MTDEEWYNALANEAETNPAMAIFRGLPHWDKLIPGEKAAIKRIRATLDGLGHFDEAKSGAA